MKKILLAIVALVISAGTAMAEKGDMSAGLSIGVAPNLSNVKEIPGVIKAPGANFGFALKFDYSLTNDIRLEAGLEDWVRSNDHSMVDIYVNGQYLIEVTKAFKVYPLIGLGYGREKASYWTVIQNDDILQKLELHDSANRFIFNIGAGADYKLTDKLTANFEMRYMYVNHFDKFPITVGLRYAF